MRIKDVAAVFAAIVIILFSATLSSSAQVAEEPPHTPGVVEGTGTHLEITDSEYLNISLSSSEDLSARIESMPEMVVLEINASTGALSSNIRISGFSPNTTYHKYEDDYHNHASFSADENGVFYFNQDLSRDHIIFIQPRKSTKFIKDDATGGDCASIGNWNAASKICTLNQDVSETIQIDNNYITLDGARHSVTGSDTGNGVYVYRKSYVTIQNVNITGFSRGIYWYNSGYGKIFSSNIANNNSGIYLNNCNNNVLQDNIITNIYATGLQLASGQSNTLKNNTVGPENTTGISGSGNGNTYENNLITGNRFGWFGSGNDAVLRGNKIEYNKLDGFNFTGERCLLRGNLISGSGRDNFRFGGADMSSNDVDMSNKVEGKPIYYINSAIDKTYDSSLNMGTFYCMNCENITLSGIELARGRSQIFLWRTNNSTIKNIISPDGDSEVVLSYSSNNIVKESDFGNVLIVSSSNDNKIYNNNIGTNVFPVFINDSSKRNLFNLDKPIGGNYWKNFTDTCKNNDGDNFCDYPFSWGKMTDYLPWAKAFNFSKPSCCSSVMFLPGHQGSRLYRKDSNGGEDQLWEPTNHNEDVRQLYLDSNGESVDSEIYVGEIIDELYGIGDNIYKNFSESMDQIVSDGIINEWKPIPYDWRLPLEKIAEDGVKLENGEMDVIGEIKRMEADSKTGKVTLVGHSNGGLLAKTLIDKLKDSGDEKLVDKLIMIGAPQLGTPKATAGLLHGDEINLLYGLILDKKTARGFAENMVSAYNLLPSSEYFNIVQSPVIEFDEDVSEIYDFRSLYGENIDNWNEFEKFLLGDDGARTDPDFGDTDSPNILREALLERAEETHDNLDDWQAPEDLEIIQIAGWGLDTIRGIKYDDCDIPFCPDKLSNLDRELILTEDGDKTVVVPSAVELSEGAERYYLNLYDYNYFLNFNVPRDHADILEVEPLQNFIKNVIQDNRILTDYISTEKPEVKDEDRRLRFRLHSPVAIDIYDQDENHTGLVQNDDSGLRFYEEKIPNSYYMEFGNTKYAGTGDYPVDIQLTGEDLGTFSFEIDQVAGDQVIETTEFSNIPVMENMKAYISIDDSVGEMQIDIDNDGQTDMAFGAGEEIEKEDLLEILEKIIYSLDVDSTVRDRLVNKIDNAQKQMEKGHIISANAMLENVKQQIETFSREQTPEKFRIPEDEAEKLIGIIERIQTI